MGKLSLLLTFIFTLIIFQGCSQKKYFEPEDTQDHYMDIYDLGATITDLNSNGATLDDNSFISTKGPSSITLEDGYRFLNESDNKILSTNDHSLLSIKTNDKTQKIQFDKNIVSAAIDKNLIALGFIDNSIGLYDLNEDKIVFREYFTQSSLNDVRITNPVFLNSLILFPTLDGKIVIINKASKTVYKTINLDPQSDINNVIFIKAMGNTLVAATPKKVFSFVNGRVKTISQDVRAVTAANGNVYVATLEGEIIKYDENLNKLKSKKFKFAKFHAIAFAKSLYTLESQGYLIRIDSTFNNVEILDFSFNEEEKVIAIDNKIYFEDNYITLQ